VRSILGRLNASLFLCMRLGENDLFILTHIRIIGKQSQICIRQWAELNTIT
jgi:hypothetical protein